MPEPTTLEQLIGILDATIGLYMTSIVIMGLYFLIGQLLGNDDFGRLEDGTIPGMVEFADSSRTEGGLNVIVEIVGGVIGVVGGVLTYIILGLTGVTYEVLISSVLDNSVSFYPRLYLMAAIALVTSLYLQERVVESMTWDPLEF